MSLLGLQGRDHESASLRIGIRTVMIELKPRHQSLRNGWQLVVFQARDHVLRCSIGTEEAPREGVSSKEGIEFPPHPSVEGRIMRVHRKPGMEASHPGSNIWPHGRPAHVARRDPMQIGEFKPIKTRRRFN